MHLGTAEKLPWAIRSDVLITQPQYTEGTLSVNQASAALTGSGTLWNTNNIHGVANVRVGGKFKIIGQEVYTVLSVASDTSVTLASNFVGVPTTGSTTAFANAGGGQVTVTSVAHGLANNVTVVISGTTSYNGVFTITNKTDDTFEITDTFVANDATGTWETGAVSAQDYVYFEDEYALASDFLRPVDLQNFSQNFPIRIVGRQEFNRRYVNNNVPGQPFVATLLDLGSSGNTSPRRRVRFSRPPDKAYQIPYEYITENLAVSSTGTLATNLSANTDEPIVPLRWRMLIVLHALHNWYRDKKDDVRSQEVKSEYTELLSRAVGDSEIGQQRAQFRPANARYMRRAKQPWRGGGRRRFDINDRFDRFEE